jgi:Co/Zn/Cd efflux system component
MLPGVTAYITHGAISDILRPPVQEEELDVGILYGFASVNLLIDIVSAYMFFRKGEDVFYHNNHIPKPEDVEAGVVVVPTSNSPNTGASTSPREDGTPFATSSTHSLHLQKKQKNLNMISAFTHVGGDTLRTFSIFIAAIVTSTTSIPGYLCDAWAAAIVTATIVIMLVPISREICIAFSKIVAGK